MPVYFILNVSWWNMSPFAPRSRATGFKFPRLSRQQQQQLRFDTSDSAQYTDRHSNNPTRPVRNQVIHLVLTSQSGSLVPQPSILDRCQLDPFNLFLLCARGGSLAVRINELSLLARPLEMLRERNEKYSNDRSACLHSMIAVLCAR